MTRRGIVSSNSTPSSWPTAKRRWRIAITPRSTSPANRQPPDAHRRRLLSLAQLALDLYRQRAIRRDCQTPWRHGQCQTRKIRPHLRADRRIAAAQTFAATARLPDDGAEALARGE